MKDRTDYVTLYRIAKAYYLENQSQFHIAIEENISRPHVSRLLSKARQLGIVTIKVEMPNQMQVGKLQDQIQQLFGLEKVCLANVSNERLWKSQKNRQSHSHACGRKFIGFIGRCASGWYWLGLHYL